MDNVNHHTVIRQLFSLLPLNLQDRLLFDYYTKKLTTAKCIFIFLAAQLNRWTSLRNIALHIHAHPELHAWLQMENISASQLSRKMDAIPSELLQAMFLHGVARISGLTSGYQGMQARLGRLAIIDSSAVKLPLQISRWAQISCKESGVKLHLRLLVASPDTLFPDQMIPSTRNVGDREVSVQLVTDPDVTYIMDRGYEQYNNMDRWIRQGFRYVMRIRKNAIATVLEEYPVTSGGLILRDAKVQMGGKLARMEEVIRLVEFQDDQGRLYRIVTNRWDLTADEIAELYKSRWLIELYFKWMKQHLQLTKLFSTKPQAVWNQLFCALILRMLILYIRLSSQTKKTQWEILQLIQVYKDQAWQTFEQELHRIPTRTSRGRRPGTKQEKVYHTEVAIMGQLYEKKPGRRRKNSKKV